MPVDREVTLKQAEKLLRQGRLDGAIAEYVRLIDEQPKDWNSRNALGDLYVRAGQTDKAVEQFTAIADFLTAEGFLPRAAALYKKVLKIRSDDEHSQLQLVDIATHQGLLADAKYYLKQLGEQRRFRGDARGALEMILRLGTVDPEDAEAKVAAARAARQMGDALTAAELLKEAADVFDKTKRSTEARAALAEALELDPADEHVRTRLAHAAIAAGDHEALERYLTPDSAGDDPRLLLILVRRELQAGHADQWRATLTRLLSMSSQHRQDAIAVGCELADQGQTEAAFHCVDLVADLALLDVDLPGAASALQAFTDRVPTHIPALMKLVEVCVDGSLDDLLAITQGRLADAYLAEGRASEARVIAEDLIAREPSVPENIARFRRALELLGEPDPDAVIAARLSGEHPFVTYDGEADFTMAEPIDVSLGPPASPPASVVAPPLPVAPPPPPVPDEPDGVVLIETVDVDLSDALAGLSGMTAMKAPEPKAPESRPPAPAAEKAPPRDLEGVFADIRARVASEHDAEDQYRAGLAHLQSGHIEAAIDAFEAASRVPIMRFRAASELGRLYINRGEAARGVEWLERAAEAPAPTPDDGYALMFDLADALERLGESARALAILLELGGDVPGYRDVDVRIDRLSRVQAGE